MENFPENLKDILNGDEKEIIPGYAGHEIIAISDTSELDLLKVRHSRQTLDDYGDVVDAHIKNAEVLISERAIFDPESDELSEIDSFYRHVTSVAQENGVEMIVADPENKLTQAIVNTAVTIAPGIAAGVSGVYLINKISDLSHELAFRRRRKKYRTTEVNDGALMTRRDFLKGSLAAGVTVAGGLHLTGTFLEEIGVSEEKGELLETFLLDSLDYRNALVAKKIIELGREYETVSAVYGLRHVPGIKKFLSNPELLEEKIKIYDMTYGLFNDDEPDVYFSDQT